MRKIVRFLAVVVGGAATLLSGITPAGAFTGGTEDTANTYSERRDGRLLPARRPVPVLRHLDRASGRAHGGGYIVADTSYGYTNNGRYLGGYQRVDVPVVRNWLLDCTTDLSCPTKQ